MVKDDDTTPVALRAALLRQSTTPERAKTSKSRVLSLVLRADRLFGRVGDEGRGHDSACKFEF